MIAPLSRAHCYSKCVNKLCQAQLNFASHFYVFKQVLILDNFDDEKNSSLTPPLQYLTTQQYIK